MTSPRDASWQAGLLGGILNDHDTGNHLIDTTHIVDDFVRLKSDSDITPRRMSLEVHWNEGSRTAAWNALWRHILQDVLRDDAGDQVPS